MNEDRTEYFGANDDELQLRNSVERFLDKHDGNSASLWRELAGLGWLGACIPIAAGGYAESGREALIISERLGAHASAAPLVEAVYAPARLLCADGSVMDRHKELLAAMVAGEASLAIAWAEPGRPYRRTPKTVLASKGDDGHWVLRGRKIGLHGWTHGTSYVIVSANLDERPALFLTRIDHSPGIQMRRSRSVGGFETAELLLDDVRVPDSALIRTDEDAMTLLSAGLDSGAGAACLDMVGAVEAALAITLEYTRTRKQFGRTIAQFQVVQHRLVDLAIELEYARACGAILMTSSFVRPGARSAPAALAGVRAELMYRAQRAVADAVQLHGGIGMTEEAPVGRYFKRVAALASTWGNADFQLEIYRSTRTEMPDLLAL